MKLHTLPEPVQQALGMYEMFRRLGFEPDDLYFASDPTGIGILVLRTQGLEFNAVSDCTDARLANKRKARRIWTQAVALWTSPQVPDAERLEIINRVLAKADSLGLILALRNKGFIIPSTAALAPTID